MAQCVHPHLPVIIVDPLCLIYGLEFRSVTSVTTMTTDLCNGKELPEPVNIIGMDISVVIPLFNEEESLPELTDWIKKVMDDNRFSYEILLVDDGSNDGSWKVIEKLSKKNPDIRGIKFRRNYGKSAALYQLLTSVDACS